MDLYPTSVGGIWVIPGDRLDVDGWARSNYESVLFDCRRISCQRFTAIEPQMCGRSHRERTWYVQLRFVLCEKNMETWAEILMNGHWEEVFGKVEELLYATDDPHNYHRHIWHSIRLWWSTALLRLHVIKYVRHHQVWVAVHGPLSTSNNDWWTRQGGYVGEQIQLLMNYLTKFWGIIMICMMQSKLK